MFRIFSLVAFVGFFGLSVYLTRVYADALPVLLSDHLISGVFLYVGLTVLSIVIAPVNTFFLLPIAVTLWGRHSRGVPERIWLDDGQYPGVRNGATLWSSVCAPFY